MARFGYEVVGKFLKWALTCKVGPQRFLGLDQCMEEFAASAVSLILLEDAVQRVKIGAQAVRENSLPVPSHCLSRHAVRLCGCAHTASGERGRLPDGDHFRPRCGPENQSELRAYVRALSPSAVSLAQPSRKDEVWPFLCFVCGFFFFRPHLDERATLEQ